MSHLDAILNVLERHYSRSELGAAFARREQVLQDFHDSLAEWRGEAVEDQVWITFTDSAARSVWNIVPKENIMEGERSSGPVREM